MFSSWIRALGDRARGLFLYGLMNHMHSERRCLEDLFGVFLFGRSIGFPFLFNYYHLRLLPYGVRQMAPWKRRVLKERDFFDQVYD